MRTTCSIRCCSAGGASSNSRCASSNTNTSFGLSRSPTSGSFSNSSDSSHSRKLEYSRGFRISWSAARMLITPRPSVVVRIRSDRSSAGSPKKCVAAFLLDPQQRALDRADRLRADQAVRGGNVLALVADQAEQRAQVVQVEQQQAAVVGELEHDVEHARLGVVEFEDARQQGRAHLADGGAHGMAELAVQVPEDRRCAFVAVIRDADLGDARLQLVARRARHGQAGDVALHVGQEHRHADPREAFGQRHQRHRLAGAGGAGDQAVAVAVFRKQHDAPRLSGKSPQW